MADSKMLSFEINHKGFLENLKKEGMDIFNSLTELIANSIDAGSDKIVFTKSGDNLVIHDDGCGMDDSKIHGFFNFYNENHAEDNSMGTAGKGGKSAIFKLSEFSNNCNIKTKNNNDQYYTIDIDIEKLYREHTFDDVVTIQQMDEDEIIQWNKDRRGLNITKSTGTSIAIKWNDDFIGPELDTQFNVEKIKKNTNT